MFRLRGHSYGREEVVYLTRRQLSLSITQWEVRTEQHIVFFIVSHTQSLEEVKRSELVDRKLWEEPNWAEYKEEREEERKTALLDNAKYKKYK